MKKMKINRRLAFGILDIYFYTSSKNTSISLSEFKRRYWVSYPTIRKFLPIYFEFYKENWFWNRVFLKKIDEYQLYFDWLKKNNSSWGYWKILDLYFSLQYKSVSFFVDKLDFYFGKNKWKLK